MPPIAPKAWTVLVYMAGDNNLDPEGVLDLQEMKKVGSTADVNVLAQFDRAAGHVARRYCLRKGGLVTADAVASLGEVNSGDPAQLDDFIRWGVGTYPAGCYLLVLWNHGAGWDDTDMYADERYRSLRRLATGRVQHAVFRAPVRRALERARDDEEYRAILLDDDARDFLDNREMKKVLAAAARRIGRKLDIVGMDACLMSMAEVGCQIAGSTDYMVASEQTEPGAGWPYHTILRALAARPRMTPRDLASLIVTRYLASYGSADDVTLSACDLSECGALTAAVRGLSRALKASLRDRDDLQRILYARSRAQSYDVADNIDLADFCELLAELKPAAAVAAACHAVIDALRSRFVVAHGSKGPGVEHSQGLAIYFPQRSVSPLYAGLDFSAATGWDAFLKAYLKAVRAR